MPKAYILYYYTTRIKSRAGPTELVLVTAQTNSDG